MRGPHIRMIMAVIRTPMRADTKVSAPKMRAAPIDANRRTSQDIEPSPEEDSGYKRQ